MNRIECNQAIFAVDINRLNKTYICELENSQLSEVGNRLEIFEDECGNQRLYARVVPMPFYDPEGKRMKM